jgi:hypothetical protein
LKLQRRSTDLGRTVTGAVATGAVGIDGDVAQANLLVADIHRFLTRPANPVATRFPAPATPPGAPIGEPAMEWFKWLEPDCTWIDWRR